MSAFSSHETFFKSPSQHSQPNFSSFIKKSTTSSQKSQLYAPNHSRGTFIFSSIFIPILGKSNSNSIKNSPKSLQKPHLTKSHLSSSPPTKNNKIFLDVQPEQSSHYRLQEHSITNSKKSSNNNTQDASKDQSKDVSQASYTSETLSNPLDRFTFYNSNFSLFDTKSNSTTTRHALESPHGKTSQLSQFTSQKTIKEAINVQERLEIISKVIGEQKKQSSSNSNSNSPVKKSPTKTEKAIKAHKMDLSPHSPSSAIKILQRPETAKHVGNSHSMSLQNHGTTAGNFFGQNKQPAKKSGVGNFVSSTPSHKSIKSPINKANSHNVHVIQPNIDVDYLEEQEEEEEEKRESDQTDPYMLKSTSLVGGSGLFRSGVMSQISNNSGLIKKSPLVDNTSSDYGKYNKIYKGLENKSSWKFAPERYKRLGKGNIEENNSIPIAPGESGLLSQKASYKAQRRMKGTFLSHGDMNFFMQSPTKKNEHVNSIGNVDSITNRDNMNRRDEYEQNHNDGGMMTAKETDIQTLNSLGQVSGSYNDVDINSGASVHLASGNGSLKETDMTEKTIEMGKEQARNEEFERFFNDAMNYMCELVDGKEVLSKIRKSSGPKDHEEHVASLLDNIVKEMNSLKTGPFEVFEKVVTGKRLLVLLDMALKSVTCVAKKKDIALKRSYNKSLSGKISDKKSVGLLDLKVKFEDIYGLEPGQGIYEENEKTMREKLCKEIEKRRGELEELERLLREIKESKMLQYVQVAKGKVNNVLSSSPSKNKKKVAVGK